MTRKSKTTRSPAPELAAVVELAEIRTQRTLAAAQARLAPDHSEQMQAEDLARHVASQLAALPEDECRLLRRNVLVTVHDLEGLVDALQAQMNDLALELRKVSSHSTAASAYGRMTCRPADRR